MCLYGTSFIFVYVQFFRIQVGGPARMHFHCHSARNSQMVGLRKKQRLRRSKRINSSFVKDANETEIQFFTGTEKGHLRKSSKSQQPLFKSSSFQDKRHFGRYEGDHQDV